MTEVFRIYEPWECGEDGYPLVWHSLKPAELAAEAWAEHVGATKPPLGGWGVKHIVRAQAGNRCIRCRHPYVVGAGGAWEYEKDPTVRAEPFKLWPALWDGIEDEDIGAKLVNRTHYSPCDRECRHSGPYRIIYKSGNRTYVSREGATAGQALELDPPIIRSVEAAWRILTVHHLNGRKEDLRWWNLTSLCQRCHLEIQKRVVMERVYPFEHSAWFKPYAAGWYAYIYEGKNLTRAEAEEDLDRLLALERMA